MPEAYCKYAAGIHLFNRLPANTPNKDESRRASEEPINVCHIDDDFDARSMVESWVLSPSSARNTTKKAIPIDLSIKHPLPVLF